MSGLGETAGAGTLGEVIFTCPGFFYYNHMQAKKGRKPISNESLRKVQLPIYLRKETIEKLGGPVNAKEKLIKYAESFA